GEEMAGKIQTEGNPRREHRCQTFTPGAYGCRILHFQGMPSEEPSAFRSTDASAHRTPPARPALTDILHEAMRLDPARAHARVAHPLYDNLNTYRDAPAPPRFQALVLRAEVAVSLQELLEPRGALAEARQVALTVTARASLAAPIPRAD